MWNVGRRVEDARTVLVVPFVAVGRFPLRVARPSVSGRGAFARVGSPRDARTNESKTRARGSGIVGSHERQTQFRRRRRDPRRLRGPLARVLQGGGGVKAVSRFILSSFVFLSLSPFLLVHTFALCSRRISSGALFDPSSHHDSSLVITYPSVAFPPPSLSLSPHATQSTHTKCRPNPSASPKHSLLAVGHHEAMREAIHGIH